MSNYLLFGVIIILVLLYRFFDKRDFSRMLDEVSAAVDNFSNEEKAVVGACFTILTGRQRRKLIKKVYALMQVKEIETMDFLRLSSVEIIKNISKKGE